MLSMKLPAHVRRKGYDRQKKKYYDSVTSVRAEKNNQKMT